MTSIFKHIEKLEMGYFLFRNKFYLKLTTGQKKIRRILNKENKILMKAFCLYNDSECQISDTVFENDYENC